jgi:hypothetical protein
MFDKWVIDGTMGYPFCFCPLDGDNIVTGMNLLTDKPPGELVGVVHSDGDEAADVFYEQHRAEIDSIREATRPPTLSVPKLPEEFGKMTKQRVPFADRLSGLCAMELAAARGNPERIGEMIERLTNSLSFTIAIAANGDPKGMDEMLKGIESYLYEAATSHQKVGAFMHEAVRRGR